MKSLRFGVSTVPWVLAGAHVLGIGWGLLKDVSQIVLCLTKEASSRGPAHLSRLEDILSESKWHNIDAG